MFPFNFSEKMAAAPDDDKSSKFSSFMAEVNASLDPLFFYLFIVFSKQLRTSVTDKSKLS